MRLAPWAQGLTTALEATVSEASRFGYTVSTGPTPLGTQGQLRYSERRIWVDAPTPWQALLTLLHELGHALAGERLGLERAIAEDEPTSERRAYLYGWALVVRLELQGLVSREAWRRFHEEEFHLWHHTSASGTAPPHPSSLEAPLTAAPSPTPTLLERIRALAAEGFPRNHAQLVGVLGAPSEDVAKVLVAEIARLAGEGRSRKEIGAELGLRVDTVRRHARENEIAAGAKRGPKPTRKPVQLPTPVLEALEAVDAAEGRAAELEALRTLAERVREVRDHARG